MSIHIKTATKTINAPIGEVWGIISAWGSERLWFPNVTKSSLQGHGIGAVRTLTFSPAHFSVTERLEVLDPASYTLAYRIMLDDDKSKGSRGTLRLKALAKEQTQFTWTGTTEWIHPEYKPQLEKTLTEMYANAMDSVAKVVTK